VLIKDGSGQIPRRPGASGGTGEEDETACAHGIQQAGLFADVTKNRDCPYFLV
jgi:hypothetical protein